MTEYNNLQTTYEPSNNQFTYRNVTYAIEFKYDSKYPGMKKLVCIRNIGGSDPTAAVAIDAYCFVRLDYRLAIPIFTHYFGYTDCNTFAYSRDSYDNFYLITGFLYMESDYFHQYYDGSIYSYSLDDTIDLLSTYDMKTLHTRLSETASSTAYPYSSSSTYDWSVCDSKCTMISVLAHLLTHSLTYSLTYSLTHSLTHLLTYSLTHCRWLMNGTIMTSP